jgi:predicted permease
MTLFETLRFSMRQFRQQPIYTLACAATLALAVASGTASVAVVKKAFFDPLPYAQDATLVSLFTSVDGDTSPVSAHVLDDLRNSGSPLSEFVSMRPSGATYQGEDTTEPLPGIQVSASFFTTLGVAPALGQAWTDGDRDSVVMSWSFWQRALSGDANAIGRRIRLDGVERTIAGVMPQGFVAPWWPATDLLLPLDMAALLADPARGRRPLSVIARRSASASPAQVDTYLELFSQQQQQTHPTIHGRQRWVVEPLRTSLVGVAGPALLGTGAAALLLLLIVGANIAGLSAARAVVTQHHTAIRTALGATRRRLVVERLLDSASVALLGSCAGVWIAYGIVQLLASYQAEFLPRLSPVSLDAVTALIGLIAGLITGIVAAVLPQTALRMGSVLDPLRGARGAAGGARLTTMRSTLVVIQVAFALALIAAAGLLVRTVRHVASTPLGFEGEGLLTFNTNMPVPRYSASARQIQFERDVLEELRRLPGVSSASASVGIPIIGGTRAAMAIFGRTDELGLVEIPYFSVSPGFVSSMGIPLKAGRDLLPSDDLSAPPVTLINETMARRFWPDGNAIGARVQIGTGSPNQPWITVVGIVGDVRQHGPLVEVQPTAYGSTRQYSWPRRYFTVKIDDRRPSLPADLRAAIRKVDPAVAAGAVTPFSQFVANQTARHRLVMFALTGFGVVASVLSALGLYAVITLTSRLRRREYAVRIALGAPSHGVRWMVLRQALVLGLAGTVTGIAVAAAGTRALQGLLHGVAPLDGPSFIAAAGWVLALAVVAAWLPARQAGQVDPVEALRME